ncbi:MAG: LysE family translocator [Myxococcota bacterium]
MAPATFLLFATTTLVVVFTPGPAALAATAQGSASGVSRAQFGIAGIALANSIYFALSATGVASLIITSHSLFTAIKWLGASYLAYLAIAMFFGRSHGLSVDREKPARPRTLFARGFVVEFANPKALLFFAAIVPQFLDPTRPVLAQMALMGFTTLVLDVVVYSIYAHIGASLARSGVKEGTVCILNRVAGFALLLTALRLTTAEN